MKTIDMLKEELTSNCELRDEFEAACKGNTIDEFLKSNGYDLTSEDLKEFAKAQLESRELSDEELANVAGGGLYDTTAGAIFSIIIFATTCPIWGK